MPFAVCQYLFKCLSDTAWAPLDLTLPEYKEPPAGIQYFRLDVLVSMDVRLKFWPPITTIGLGNA